jgi:hypothetical protein
MASIKSIMKPGDFHIVVNGAARVASCFDDRGKKHWSVPARTDGQHANWREPMGDTPPGLYVCGVVYDTRGEAAYGKWCIDLIDLEDQESGNGRAGISMHGGGSRLPDPFAPYQGWAATHGCVRFQNDAMENLVEPCVRRAQAAKRKVYVTVQL